MSVTRPATDGDSAAQLIERLARLVRAAEHENGLNPAQWEALRYIARCNRFSNAPAALAEYLSATKGTVSQTLLALDRKGLVARKTRADDKRSIALELTRDGRAMLAQDPLSVLERRETEMTAAARTELVDALSALLKAELAARGHKAFGICRSCRHFRADAHVRAARRHHCALLDVSLSDDDAARICVEHEAA